MNPGPVRKAIAAAVTAAAAAAVQAVQAHGVLDWSDAGVVLGAAVVAGFATYQIRNEPPAGDTTTRGT